MAGAAMALSAAVSWVKGPNGLLETAPTPILATVSAGVAALLWWRRRWPGAVAVAIMVGYVVAFTPLSLSVAMYTVGTAYRRVRTLVVFAAGAFVADLAGLVAGSSPASGLRDSFYVLALIMGMLVVGYGVGVRHDLATEAKAKAEGLEREQHLLTQHAQAEERARIAREMHDVVAHRVGNIVLSAGALKVSPVAREAPQVAKAAEQIREDGHHALEELREILGVLTPGRAAVRAPYFPQPDASQLASLVEQARGRGQSARLEVNGHPEALPPAVQRAIYRIVQEALTNAAKHAPGAAVDLNVDCRLEGVHVGATNGPSDREAGLELPPSGGYGLAGLTERVELLGGTLTAGPHGDSFRVSAFLPLPS
ncbi:sensor histidine kinase [Streptomyces sp. NPDC096198]|uniref:sensor histidine kinase n=1 Tax=Streptomyces sp. NPDC096198 TaxID=3366080 RepID=UPI0038032CE6